MTDAVLAALITGGLSLLGVVFTNVVTAAKSRQTISEELRRAKAGIEKVQAVTEIKIEELTREVRMHNNFAQRIPVVEEQIKNITYRLKDLEQSE